MGISKAALVPSGAPDTPRYPGIDRFRTVAALLVVAIHTAPLSGVSQRADLIVTLILARVAVPFFLMVTGCFVLGPWAVSGRRDAKPFHRYFGRTAALYGIAVALYLPVNLYAGHFAGPGGMGRLLQALLIDGTMYHLWYLPAALLGTGLLYLLLGRLSVPKVACLALALYLVGLLGDSYYGLIAGCPLLEALYDGLFAVTAYTRNGLFYAPIFLMIGVLARKGASPRKGRHAATGLALSLSAMIIEGLALHALGLPRHDAMYLFLPPCCYFLFQLLLSAKGNCSRWLSRCVVFVYILHPMAIILIRGAARLTGTGALAVENSLVHYLLVCALSYGGAAVFLLGRTWLTTKLRLNRNRAPGPSRPAESDWEGPPPLLGEEQRPGQQQ